MEDRPVKFVYILQKEIQEVFKEWFREENSILVYYAEIHPFLLIKILCFLFVSSKLQEQVTYLERNRKIVS